MNLIEKHKEIIAWYQIKLGLSDYGLLLLVFLSEYLLLCYLKY